MKTKRKRWPAAKFRKAMSGAGATNRELARELGVSPDTIKTWKSGRRRPCCKHMETAVWATLQAWAT